MSHHPIHAIADFFGDIGRARKAQATYSRLSQQSDAALAARGLRREDLPAYSYKSAFGE
ncbi:hypothetical protein [Mariluticola halotolerans]|uniref:hypothetical protein n=1 Tax=Mariluticola halotolerans TaxID=2909283 RepID=UPI0026E37CC3|nr:hypothetical protein [Mariluticola halotolerans]UJQ94089.1 hypothetical protein L1P08_14165 [Mariluticola halotolerans]